MVESGDKGTVTNRSSLRSPTKVDGFRNSHDSNLLSDECSASFNLWPGRRCIGPNRRTWRYQRRRTDESDSRDQQQQAAVPAKW